ncbi:hypothetical protein BOX15_Mlig001559g2, partial [Macrostomum lignano]
SFASIFAATNRADSIVNSKELTGSAIVDNKELTGSAIVDNKELTGSAIVDNKELIGSFIADNKELTGSFIADNKELTGSSIANNKELTGSFIANNKELTRSFIADNKELIGSSLAENKELTGSSIANNKELTGSFIANNKELTGSFIADNKELIGSSLAESKELTGSSIAENKELIGSSIADNKELTGSSIADNKELTGSSIENNKELIRSFLAENKGLTEIFIAENKDLSRSSSNEPIDSSTKYKKEDGSKRSLVADQPKLTESCHNTEEESGLSSSKAGAEGNSEHTDSSSTLDCNSVCEAAGECSTSTNAEDAASDALVEPLMEKHLLNSCWTLWFYKSDRSRVWLDSQLPVANFSSVEDFWRIINFAMPPSRLPPGCDYSVFRAGCPPMWEAPDNCNGGRWMLSLDRRSTEAALVDKAWTEALLMAIGEDFSDRVGRQICGLVVQIRSRHYRLCLWTRHAADQPGCFAVGRLFRSALQKAIQPDALPALILRGAC